MLRQLDQGLFSFLKGTCQCLATDSWSQPQLQPTRC